MLLRITLALFLPSVISFQLNHYGRPAISRASLSGLPDCRRKATSNNYATNTKANGNTLKMEIFEGNPIGKWIYNRVWSLPIFRRGTGSEPLTFGDSAYVLKKNIEQLYGGEPSVDGAPVAEGDFEGFAEGTGFLALYPYYENFGPIYKLLFGPKSFIVVSDPVVARHLLKDKSTDFDKGLLAEILKPIMGKGLIPADWETWKSRRRAIVPGFHKKWLDHMVKTFGECNNVLVDKLFTLADSSTAVEMEGAFCSVSLDIIGKAVFNYEFNSVTEESPIIKAVYRTLQEAEHRSLVPFPYWNMPLANQLVPRLREFNRDLKLVNDVLDKLIANAMATSSRTDLEELESRNYDKVSDASFLRFLTELEGDDVTSVQLRDDLMTMLIAGHETTAALLTWALFELGQQPALVKELQEEIDGVFGPLKPNGDGGGDDNDGRIAVTWDDITKLKLVRYTCAESLRMYPEPPILIRRSMIETELPPPADGKGKSTPLLRATDLFISVYNLHRSPAFWREPNTFRPQRFDEPFSNPDQPGWGGYTPLGDSNGPGGYANLYPNEINSNFAFLPFGGGTRKCVGDQFAVLEATVCLTQILRHFEFEFVGEPSDVGMRTGATIHTANGLNMKVKRRTS